MKNKRTIYVLIPAVVVIWGLIGYRIVKSINPNSEVRAFEIAKSSFTPKEIIETKTYTINANYRDPFLGTVSSGIKLKKKKKFASSEPIIFPNIIFQGVVSPKAKKNDQIFLVNINGQQQLLKIRESSNEVKLISGNETEIVVKYKKQKQTYLIQN